MKHFYLIILILIVTLGFFIRLYKFDNPIADWHSWRQADTSAVTRNFFKLGFTPFVPRFDDFSDITGKGLFNPNGYRFVEFPLYNVLHYFSAIIFSALSLEQAGRLTTIILSLTSAILLYNIVTPKLGRAHGLLSALFFTFLPYNIYYSRVILPDPLMVTLWLAAIWTQSKRMLVVSCFLASLSLMVKPTAIFFLIPFFFGLKDYLKSRTLILGIGAIVAPFLLWRTYSHLHPEGIPASTWLLNGNKIRFRPAFFRWMFYERLGIMFLGTWGVWPFLAGVLSSSFHFILWGLGALLYVVVFATGNIQHDYYQIPIIPVISVYLSIGFIKLWNMGFANRVLVSMCTLFMFAMTWYTLKGNYSVNRWEIVKAGQAVNRITPPEAIVIAPYIGDTAFLYQTNRRGFSHLPLPVKDLIDRYKASYYVSVNYDQDTAKIMSKYIVVERTPDYVIVKLEEPYYQ